LTWHFSGFRQENWSREKGNGMTSAPSKTTTVKTVNNKTGVTTATSTSVSGGSTTVTKSTTIGTAKTVSSPSATSAATMSAELIGGKWIAGPNDGGWNLCTPVAVANALLGATGLEATSAQIERLYARAGGTGSSGVPVTAALSAASRYGLAGCRLKSLRRAALDDADLILAQFPQEDGLHAAAFAGMTVITWGGEIPLEDLDAQIVGAWALTWHGQETA
jgi:hypothetical protein